MEMSRNNSCFGAGAPRSTAFRVEDERVLLLAEEQPDIG